MSTPTASIRELRSTALPGRKPVQPSPTGSGKPAVKRQRKPRSPLPDYMARLLKHQPVPMSEQAVKELWDYKRGDR